MNLPRAPAQYSRDDQDNVRTELTREDVRNLKRNTDIDLGIAGARLIIRSPNGTAWKLTVDNAGALTAALVP